MPVALNNPDHPHITRREALKRLGAATAVAGFGPLWGEGVCSAEADSPSQPSLGVVVLRNDKLEFSVSLSNGRAAARSLHNRITGEEFILPTDDVAFEFEGGGAFPLASGTAEFVGHGGDRLELLYRREDVEARVVYRLPEGRHYLRKQVSVRCTGGSRRLLRADLENWTGVGRDWRSMATDFLKFGSHPIHSDTVFAGVEFVVAFNDCGPGGFVLRSRPGGVSVTGDWVSLNSTVAGVAQPGRVRAAFLDYLDDVRLKPARLVACYNSWWTLPAVVTAADNVALIRALKEGLSDRHGVFFDFVTTDMGWSDPRSIWEIDRRQLPNGFEETRGIVEGAGGRLGLWMSPGELYSQACDYDWLGRNGYVVLRGGEDGKERDSASLADPKYRAAAKKQLERLAGANNLGHFKFDGFVAEEGLGHDGLLPNEDSVEPIAGYSLELLEAARKARGDLVTEETFFNRVRNYVSPWILKYSDTVYGNAGDDCPRGMNPAPDYRESHTNAREYYIQAMLGELWLPQNAVQCFDIVHCDPAAGFANHAAMAVGRGRFFLSTYLNPKFMSGEDWRVYAGLLKWARANQDTLRETVVIPGRVEEGECYAYAHWRGDRGILVVRNPSNATCSYDLDLRKAGTPGNLSQAVCYTQYPYRRGIARGMGADSVVSLSLAPWELLFMEVVPERDLAEPIAMGARWYSDPEGTRIAPDRGAEEVTWLEPRGGVRTVRVPRRPAAELSGRILRQSVRPAPREEWLVGGSGPVETVAFELDCEATLPGSASGGTLLLLVEFPGREYRSSRCAAMLNGRRVELSASSSESAIGTYMDLNHAQFIAARPHESEWCWYQCALPAGQSRVEFSGAAGFGRPRIGLWVWSEENLGALAQPLAAGCSEPAMPQYQGSVERDGRCLRPSTVIF